MVAQCLVERGMPAVEAIGLVRRCRSPWALHNEVFTAYLTTGIDTAALLSGLDPLP